MKLPVNFPQPVAGDVRVNFRRADAGVPQQFLDDPQVGSMLQKVSCKAMAQHMRSNIPLNARVQYAFFDAQPESHGRES